MNETCLSKPYDDGTLKWKSHDITNAKTMQASKKLRKRWPCQNLRGSVEGAGVESVAAAVVALLPSLTCSVESSFVP